jgi:Na+/H+ antiporter NhaA
MSLFVAGLAFEDDSLLSLSKIAILGASLISGIGGGIVLARGSSPIVDSLAEHDPASGREEQLST